MRISDSVCKGLIHMDNICAHTPILSTISAIFNGAMKYFVINKSNCEDNRYYWHLYNISPPDLVIISIPILGNFYALTCSLEAYKWHKNPASREQILEDLSESGYMNPKKYDSLYHSPLRNDPVFMKKAIQTEWQAIRFTGWELSKNVDFYLDLLETCPFAPGLDLKYNHNVVGYASTKIRSDERLQAALERALERANNS